MATEFDLDKNKLFEIFREKGIENLYHANTIATSISFLNEKSLLSRKFVLDNNLFQTDQYSDEKDKKFGIWDGIFLDAMDIHTVFNRRNKYGPVLFSFSTELLKSDLVNSVRITRVNPVHWNSTQSEKDWYYSDLDEFKNNYKKGNKLKDVGSMLILNDINGKLPLRPFFNKLILDNPNVSVNYNEHETYLSDIIAEKILEVLTKNKFEDIPKHLRHKNSLVNCICWSQYKNFNRGDLSELKKLFHPNPVK
ncbi:hypothetical protein ACFPVY_17100 [Flavobacterium qiangtangense]|uniref:DUF4433 domain-containing protein n=1 Tax=Flavobacterium qiangtangense TaxID=1442595 RepID=A0ABW1PRW7_9FLAO